MLIAFARASRLQNHFRLYFTYYEGQITQTSDQKVGFRAVRLSNIIHVIYDHDPDIMTLATTILMKRQAG